MTHTDRFVARDLDTGLIIADRVSVATTRAQRRTGLLRHDRLEPGEGLWIAPCNGVHTCFMRFAIDLLAMDRNGVVVDAVSTLKPWRMRLPRRGSWSVLELPAGTLNELVMPIGHKVLLDQVGHEASARQHA